MQITIASIKKIEKIFEKDLQDEYLSRSLGKILGYEKDKTITEVKSLKDELLRFEKNYKMSSDEFFQRFERGEMGDEEDYFEWSAMYQMYKKSEERLNMLEEVS